MKNPFYRNYLFNSADLMRAKLTWAERLRVFFKPMMVQVADGYAFHYKTDDSGAIYLFKAEPLSPLPVTTDSLLAADPESKDD